MPLRKIVSGGQTGVDRGALDAALDLGFPCGGWCPQDRLAEDGPIDPSYPLIAMEKSGYEDRTRRNVLESDGSAVIHFGQLVGGTELTVKECKLGKRPFKLIDASQILPSHAAEQIRSFIEERSISVLNVAGPRQSEAPAARAYSNEVVRNVIQAVRAASTL